METTNIRLLLVDDHPLVRDGLRARLSALEGLAVVGEAGDATEKNQLPCHRGGPFERGQ